MILQRVARSVLSASPLPIVFLNFCLNPPFARQCTASQMGGWGAREIWVGWGDAIGYWQPESRFHSQKIVPEDITLSGE